MTQRLLVIGASFAGLWSALGAARVLDENGRADRSIEIALIAPQAALHVRPRLYEENAGTMTAPLQGSSMRLACGSSRARSSGSAPPARRSTMSMAKALRRRSAMIG